MSTRLTLLAHTLPPRLRSAYFFSILFWTTVIWGQSAGSLASPIPNFPISKQTDQGSLLQLDQLEKPSTLVRAEFALNEDGDFTTYFTVGDRF
jgi:hypothetical protein